MEKRKENPITKFNKINERKKRLINGKINWTNLTQINGGFISPTNVKNIRLLNNQKERPQSNENIKIKLLDGISKSENNSFGIFQSQENNISSKGRIINYIKKKHNKNKSNSCSNSVVIQSKTPKKLIENFSIRRNQNYKKKNLISSNNLTNHSTIGNTSNGNQNIEKILAKEIIEFFDEMKKLQISICKKEPNVRDLKKNFEKKKSNLYKEALKYSKTENNIHNQISQDNRSYSSLFSSNSAFTSGTYNGLNNNQNIKELNDSITTLKTALEDLKSNSQFITSQLRLEITNLNEKIIKQMNIINQFEKNINNNLNSIKGIYKLLKPIIINLNLNLNSVDSLQSQNSFSNSINLNENKFEWYESNIKNMISRLEIKMNNIQNLVIENNNNHNQDQKSSIGDIPDNKLYFFVKNASSEIIEMIRPYINEEENENELNSIFDTKENIEDGIIVSAIENVKKDIKSLISQINNLHLERDKLLKELKDSKIQNETYKNTLNHTILNKIKSNDNINNIKEEDENYIESENYKRLNNDLLAIQNELLQKLEMKDIENERNQETIKELLLINKNEEINIINDNSSNCVSNEKYRYLLNLYSNEQDQLKQLKNDYLHLIQDLSNYVENGTKISLDINKISFNTNKRSTNELNFEEEPDSIELGRINENDLLTDKNSTISNKNVNNRINSRESKGSNCATFNKYINVTSNIPSNKMVNIKHITSMKIELKQSKNEIEKLNKKLTDLNDVLSTIGSAISKLFQEVQYSNKGKELFNLIFKLLNYSEDTIHKMFTEKEKMKK